jgi:WD40 repeat protein
MALEDGTQHCIHLAGVPTENTMRSIRTGDGDSFPALSPDGKILAEARAEGPIRGFGSADGVIRLWSVATGRERRVLKGHEGYITQMAFSPDGKVLASVGRDGLVHLWDVARGKELRRLKGHVHAVFSVAFAPDGKTVASGCDGSLRLWDVATGREIWNLDVFRVEAVAFAPGGRALASGCHTAVCLWDPATGKKLREMRGHEEKVTALAFSRDGQTLASGSLDRTIRLWDPATGQERRPLPGHKVPVTALAYAPGGGMLATGDRYGHVLLWEPATGKLLRQFDRDGTDLVEAVAFAPDGRRLSAAGLNLAVHCWEPVSGKLIRRVELRPELYLLALGFAPDGQQLAAGCGGQERRLLIRDVDAGANLRSVGRRWPWPPGPVVFAPDCRTLAAAPEGGPVRIWDRATGKELRTLAGSTGHVPPAFGANGKTLVAVGEERTARLWDLDTGQEVRRWQLGDFQLHGLAYSPDGRLVASSMGPDAFFGTIHLWEAATGQERIAFHGNQGEIHVLAFAPDGRTLASAGTDNTVLIWDVAGVDPPEPRPRPLTPRELRDLWADLADADAPRAHRAIGALTRAPGQTVPFLSERLRPVTLDVRRIDPLIGDLDDAKFAIRQRATAELEAFGEAARPALRRTLAERPTLEVRRRVERLLEQLDQERRMPSPERLRQLRALEVLERIGSPQAGQIFATLAQGSPQAWLTQEAQGALGRLKRRDFRP